MVKGILHFSVQQVNTRIFLWHQNQLQALNISKIMTMCPIFHGNQKFYLKEAFQNKTIILTLSFTGQQKCIKCYLPDISISIVHFFKALLVFHE